MENRKSIIMLLQRHSKELKEMAKKAELCLKGNKLILATRIANYNAIIN